MSGNVTWMYSIVNWHNAYHYFLPLIPSVLEIELSIVLTLLSLLRYGLGEAEEVAATILQKGGPSTHRCTNLCSSKAARSFNSSTSTAIAIIRVPVIDPIIHGVWSQRRMKWIRIFSSDEYYVILWHCSHISDIHPLWRSFKSSTPLHGCSWHGLWAYCRVVPSHTSGNTELQLSIVVHAEPFFPSAFWNLLHYWTKDVERSKVYASPCGPECHSVLLFGNICSVSKHMMMPRNREESDSTFHIFLSLSQYSSSPNQCLIADISM